MNLNYLKKLYTNSPMWVKKFYSFIPYDIRNGREYRDWRKFLKEEIDIEEYQLLKLKETISYAYENTSYYKKLFDKLDCKVYDFNSLEDIKHLPFINKDIVRQNYSDMIVKNYPKNRTFYVTTGGSSGEPMKFLQSRNIWAKELAFVNNYFQLYGYSNNDLKASFRGGDFDIIKNNQFWKMNPINNEIHFSPFHISIKTIEIYLNQLNYLKPKFIHSYPSAILSLIENMKNINIKLDYQLQCIFLISENITSEEIDYIKNYFNCDVTTFFGHSERLVFASMQKNRDDVLQIDKRYGFTELINNASENSEIIGTSFDNFAMPLIRYQTGDYTSYQDKDTELLNFIEGRWDKEYLDGKDGLKITLTALNMHSDIFKNVINFQFYQVETAKVEILIVPNKNYNNNDNKNILDALNKKVGHALKFEIKIIDRPILTKRGKLKKLLKELS